MSSPDAPTDSSQQTDSAGYIRGGAGTIDGRRAARLAVGVLLVLLAAFTVVLVVEGFKKNARTEGLRKNGVAVNVTVTSCLGLASGTGITVTSYECRGAFTFKGHQYNDVIGDSGVNRATGSTFQGVVNSVNTSVLSASDKVATSHASWRSFVAAASSLVVLVIAWLLARPLLRRPKRQLKTMPPS